MLNFCNSGLAEIGCDKPSCDGHSITNLISTNADRKKGFLVDYFVKPPVEIRLKFSCNINIRKINLNCLVGSQKSKVIHIISETTNNLQSVIAKGSVGTSENHLVFHVRGTQRDKHGRHETFYNTKNLTHVKYLIVKILHTESSTVPALGGLEIWGFISPINPKSTKDSVLRLWRNIQSLNDITKNIITIPSDVINEKEEDAIEPFKIPEEFLDPITCEIFTIPMMLPSGKIVDIITLEKFYKAEEKWGRDKSDPFTGVFFTDGSKPVVATSLKERLDKFLMDNCNMPILKNIPRTVGRIMKQNGQLQNESNYYSFNASVSYETPQIGKRKLKDIDSLLEQSLNGLPTFLEKPVVKKKKVECMKCNKVEVLFKLLCEHFICRYCLVLMDRTEDNRCICNKKISFNDIIRYHISV